MLNKVKATLVIGLIVVVGLGLIQQARAQGPEEAFELKEVVVTGTKT